MMFPILRLGKYYIRVADEDRELSPRELRRIMIGKEYEENWEDRATGETIDDVDGPTLTHFYKSATACGRLPDVGEEKAGLLKRLGLLRGMNLTNAGKYLFSKNKPIILKMAVLLQTIKRLSWTLHRRKATFFS